MLIVSIHFLSLQESHNRCVHSKFCGEQVIPSTSVRFMRVEMILCQKRESVKSCIFVHCLQRHWLRLFTFEDVSWCTCRRLTEIAAILNFRCRIFDVEYLLRSCSIELALFRHFCWQLLSFHWLFDCYLQEGLQIINVAFCRPILVKNTLWRSRRSCRMVNANIPE